MIEMPQQLWDAFCQRHDGVFRLVNPTTQHRFVRLPEAEYARLVECQQPTPIEGPTVLQPASPSYSFDPVQRIRETFDVDGEIRVIPDADGFALSEKGEIFSFRALIRDPENGKIVRIKAQLNKKTLHVHYNLRCSPKPPKSGTLSNLILQVFLPRVNHGGLHARHIDGNPQNNVLSNLEWGTIKENMGDRDGHGRNPWGGTRNPHSKLTPEKVWEIRKLLELGVTSNEIQLRFPIGPTAVRDIKARRTWSNI